MTQTLSCTCGQVRLAVEAAGPIASVECCCTSCREAGSRLARLPGAVPVLSSFGATRFELYRKDRVRVLGGEGRLGEFRLSPKARTRRVVATCCNAPVFLEFEGGHWLSLYGSLWPEGTLPPLQMRTMTADLPDPSVLPSDVPNARGQSLSFFAKLLGAWVAMGFLAPKVKVASTLHV
jgi:hypothetical protein